MADEQEIHLACFLLGDLMNPNKEFATLLWLRLLKVARLLKAVRLLEAVRLLKAVRLLEAARFSSE